jgi:UDPglucose--hexose-1-phosphate uridylyltransferase
MELLRSEIHEARTLPTGSSEPAAVPVEFRWDPLTGHTTRLLASRGALMPQNDFDLHALSDDTATTCPFCGESVDALTPRLLPEISHQGRIRRGEAVLFPNLLAYAKHASVSVYSAKRHYLPLGDMTPELVGDNLATQVAFAKAVQGFDPESRWASVNANHMLPSGSSLFHPHLQGAVDPTPTTMQRLLAGTPPERFTDYLGAERVDGRRYLGSTGSVEWLASFAPILPAELRAFVPGWASPAELSPALVEELGAGIAIALGLYAEMGYESFNLAVYGAPPVTPGYPLNLRMGVRSNLKPLYRSDSTYLERLHWEGAVDLFPEDVAELAGDRFRR